MKVQSPEEMVLEFHTVYGQPVRTVPTSDVPERELRIQLIQEELEEYAEADSEDDIVEIADALADLVYVTWGAILAHGFQTSLTGAANKIYSTIPTTVKGQPSLNSLQRKDYGLSLSAAVMEYSVAEPVLPSHLENILSLAYMAAISYNIRLDSVLAEVQASNLSKLGEDGKPIYREDGKVLKGPAFFNPGIKEVLDRQE